MTKQELMDELTRKAFCGRFLGLTENALAPDDLKRAAQVKWYHAHYMEVVGKAAATRKISIYVFDEGQPTEAAYYGDAEPAQRVKGADVLTPEL